jgi:chromosomal replication initiator protein
VTKDDMEIVSALEAALADKVGKQRYELWFGANARMTLEADALRVSVSTPFYEDWLRRNFRRHIEDACRESVGRALAVMFTVDAELVKDATAARAAPRQVAARDAAVAGPGDSRPEEIAHATPQSRSSPAFSLGVAETAGPDRPAGRRRFDDFESFAVGSSNRLAATSAAEVIEHPGRMSPLLIHGPTGAGKTHLLEAIWTASKRRYSRTHAVYLSAEQFTSYFLSALHGSGLPSFRSKYRGVELLLIDDLQFFAGKKATISELVHTIDTLARHGRQVVFAADRPPTALAALGPELVARLTAGLVCRIDPPEYETRLAIARGRSARLGLELPQDVLELVAENCRSHAREITGALLKLHATSRLLARPVTLTIAREALSDQLTQSRRAVKLADVQQAVCEVFGLEPQALRSARRTSAVAHPRMLAMWLARKYTRAALAEIGEFFGNRTHTTVISANKKVGQWLNDPKSLRLADHTLSVADAVRKVEERLLAS